MSKSSKSKNTTFKKVRKFKRQGKYLKALKVCDDYLDNAIADEKLILLKIDILVEYYNNDDFIGLINDYKIKLTNFLNEDEEIELLKIYNTLDNYLELKTQNLASDGIVKSYLAGGLLIDNLETILVLNEMVKDNSSNGNHDKYNEKTEIPQDLRSFVENISKTAYQYLELILINPKEEIANSDFDLDKLMSKLRKFLEPEESEDSEKSENFEEKIVEDENKSEIGLEENSEIEEKTEIGLEENSELDERSEISLEENSEIEKETEIGLEISELEDKSEISFEEIINPNEKEENLLKLEDKTEIAREYSAEDEIQGLKDIISYLNDKNEFKKALIYQRRLVKLAREENIKSYEEIDSQQRTLSEFEN